MTNLEAAEGQARDAGAAQMADPGSASIAALLEGLGLTVSAETVALWLPMLAVLALEIGSLCAGMLVEVAPASNRAREGRDLSKVAHAEVSEPPVMHASKPCGSLAASCITDPKFMVVETPSDATLDAGRSRDVGGAKVDVPGGSAVQPSTQPSEMMQDAMQVDAGASAATVHALQARIIEALRADPDASQRALASSVGATQSTVSRHMAQMRREGSIKRGVVPA